MSRARRTLVAAILLAAALPAFAREKTDRVLLSNGDELTGEVKSLGRGKLDLSTDHSGRMSIKWDRVTRLTSSHVYEAELTTGERLVGPLSSPEAGMLQVGLPPENRVVPLVDVVALVPMDDEFVNRVRALLDLGFTLAKSKWATTLSTSGEFGYRTQDLGAQLNFDGYYQNDVNSLAVSRWSVALQGDWYFRDHWRAILGTAADRNDELQLLLRTTLAAGVAHAVVRNGWTDLWITAGLAGSRESYVGTSPDMVLDFLAGASWNAFRYDTPKLDLVVDVAILPGLSDFGRVRGTLAVKLRYEVFKDFNAGINFSDSFDSRPPDPTAPKNDFITSLTVGWSYRR